MSQHNHDPAMSAYSTARSLRKTLEALKDRGEFHITVEIGGEADENEALPVG